MADWDRAAQDTLWFKKVDSVLRGNPVEETVAMMEARKFRRCIFAPAFPDMGRVTRNGRHYSLGPGGQLVPTPVHDLAAAFIRAGMSTGAPGDRHARVWIVDAQVQPDLDVVAAKYRGEGGILWAGARGLAGALAVGARPLPHPTITLVIAGTTHPMTRRQMEVLAQRECRSNDPLIIDPVLQAANAAETEAGIRQGLATLATSLEPGSTVMVIGGDTLSIVLDWAKPAKVACIGEVAPGLPLARLEGGQLDGMTLLTKSGGFGDAQLLQRLVSAAS